MMLLVQCVWQLYNAVIKQLYFSEKGYLENEDYYWNISSNNYYTGIYYVEIQAAD